MPSKRRPPTVEEMVHPAVRQHFSAGEGSSPAFTAAPGGVVAPHVQPAFERAQQRARDLAAAEEMAAAERGEMAYDHGTGEGATPLTAPAAAPAPAASAAPAGARSDRAQRAAEAYQFGQQYLNNPFTAKGRARIGRQFWQAPLGGHVRSAAEGLGLEADHARLAEQGLAGLTAVGIGVPAFMAAVQQLSTPPDPNTIPL